MPELDDAVGDMVDDLLACAGRSVGCYRDGVLGGTITMARLRQQSATVDVGDGGFVEFIPYDFVTKTSDLIYDPPLTGDRFKVGSETYEAVPLVGEKTYRRMADQMTRIHTKQVPTP